MLFPKKAVSRQGIAASLLARTRELGYTRKPAVQGGIVFHTANPRRCGGRPLRSTDRLNRRDRANDSLDGQNGIETDVGMVTDGLATRKGIVVAVDWANGQVTTQGIESVSQDLSQVFAPPPHALSHDGERARGRS